MCFSNRTANKIAMNRLTEKLNEMINKRKEYKTLNHDTGKKSLESKNEHPPFTNCNKDE